MPSNEVRVPGSLTGRRAPLDLGYWHFCSETCVHITPLQRVVLERVACGASSKEIARTLGVREQTVKNRIAVLQRKLGSQDRVQLALTAVASGIIANPQKSLAGRTAAKPSS